LRRSTLSANSQSSTTVARSENRITRHVTAAPHKARDGTVRSSRRGEDDHGQSACQGGCRFGIPELIKAGGGSVINMSSNVALMGVAGRNCYTAAKGGIARPREAAHDVGAACKHDECDHWDR
jgi:NAD(P)-dependent dehydrogenase (short-subunit alcohol dehydrogenase family)